MVFDIPTVADAMCYRGVSLDPKEQTYNSSANVNGRIPDVAEVIEGYEGEDLSTKGNRNS